MDLPGQEEDFDTLFLNQWIAEIENVLIWRSEEIRQKFLKQSLNRILWPKLAVDSFIHLLGSFLALYIHVLTLNVTTYNLTAELDALILYHYAFSSLPMTILADLLVFRIGRKIVYTPRDLDGIHRLYSLSLIMTANYIIFLLAVGILVEQVYLRPYLSSKYNYSFNDVLLYIMVSPFSTSLLSLSNTLLESTGFSSIVQIQKILSVMASAVIISASYLFIPLYTVLKSTQNSPGTAYRTSIRYGVVSIKQLTLYPAVIAILLPDVTSLLLNLRRLFSYRRYKECYRGKYLIDKSFLRKGISSGKGSFESPILRSTDLPTRGFTSETVKTYSLSNDFSKQVIAATESLSTKKLARPSTTPTLLTRKPYSDTLYQHDFPFPLMVLAGKLFPTNSQVLFNIIIDIIYKWLSVVSTSTLALVIIIFIYFSLDDIDLLVLNISICALYIFLRHVFTSVLGPVIKAFRRLYFFSSHAKNYRKVAVAFYYYLFISFILLSVVSIIFYFMVLPYFTLYFIPSGPQFLESKLADNIFILRLEILTAPLMCFFYMSDVFLEQQRNMFIGFSVKLTSLAAGVVTLIRSWGTQRQFSNFVYPLLISDVTLYACSIIISPLVIFNIHLLVLEVRVASLQLGKKFIDCLPFSANVARKTKKLKKQ